MFRQRSSNDEYDRKQSEMSAPQQPIFDLGQVQYSLPARLISLVVSSDILAMGLANNVLVLLELLDWLAEIELMRVVDDVDERLPPSSASPSPSSSSSSS